MQITERPRRLRQSSSVRDLVEETTLTPRDLIWPVFVKEGDGQREPIKALPGCNRLSVDELLKDIEPLIKLGLRGIALFPCIADSLKDPRASEVLNKNGLIPRTVRALKDLHPELCVITDVALDPYSSDGHDGLYENGKILNDQSLSVLANQALVHAEAGADFVAPSDMMDGRVAHIREALDAVDKTEVGIISYCAKYASGFYGPFREALASAPRSGDKKTYQMNPMNRREALREARLDISEGADMLMVKPALSYLDVIHAVHAITDLPIAAYNVSGEYAMVKAAAAAGLVDERTIAFEVVGSIKRAGADMILTYHAPDILRWL